MSEYREGRDRLDVLESIWLLMMSSHQVDKDNLMMYMSGWSGLSRGCGRLWAPVLLPEVRSELFFSACQ